MNHPKRHRDPNQEVKRLGSHVKTTLIARQRKLRALSETAKGDHLNDDKSPLIGLMNCIICRQTMKIEKSWPDAEGKDIIQYRCGRCDRIELVRLLRRSRDVPA